MDHPGKKVMTSLALAGSLLLPSQSVDAAVSTEAEDEKVKKDKEGNQATQSTSEVQRSPQKVEYHVISSGIRMHMGASSGQDSSSSDVQFKRSAGFHIVKKGDTLSEIAADHGMKLKNLLKQNPQVDNPHWIQVGDRIRLDASSKESKDYTKSKQKKGSSNLSSSNGRQSGKAYQVIREAKTLLDASYQYGAEGPNHFDCSGFTQYVFKQNGYHLPRSSSAQASVGQAVRRSALKMGDLLFFRTGGGGISHVSIYMGNGQMIHATNPRSDITISNLNERYWSKRYAGARRVIQ
ncbi:LysM peptidoglycan-binding domain-containing C40 family peptidase [Melghirimyces algeriensis]|uniref:LysM domain-containing protein n=1 Tax=Melghirimyces algeriensis TaxID=910412 RepID=A0A521EX08_9BACL|nr:LysM peptidoglycan-binding domain-containing C40 family peptidase [Melghirimyces algeriensis]SMO88445.1 LysM domain-containing protein [Melghirimyces algeriensis]